MLNITICTIYLQVNYIWLWIDLMVLGIDFRYIALLKY